MNARCLFALAWALCTIFVSSPAFAQTALFSQAVNYQPGSSEPSSVYLADVNGDGKLDIVVANQSGPNGHGSVSVYFGNGDGTVQAPITYDSGGPGAVSVYVIDVNGDGMPDIVVANQGGGSAGDGSVAVLLNGAGGVDGAFQAAVVYDSGGPAANSVFVVDVNGDGQPDVIVANQGGGTAGDGSVGVLLNAANGVPGTLQAAVVYDSGGIDATAVTSKDVNGDGYADIVVGNNCFGLDNCPQQQGGVAVLLNSGTGTFVLSGNYPTGGPTTSVAVGDVNGDGINDLLVGVSTYGAGFLAGVGNGTFGSFQGIAGVSGQVVSVAVQDVNGDGINDLLIGLGYCGACDLGLGSGVTVLLGTGSGNYGSPVTYDSGGQLAMAIGLGDLNGDQKPDLVIPNLCDNGVIDDACGGNVAVLLNSISGLTTTLTSSRNPALAGQSVKYTATVVSPGGAATGTVTFRDGASVVATVPVSNNQATYTTTYSAAALHQMTATYSLSPLSQLSAILTETVAVWSVIPASGQQGQTLNVAITGAGFINGATTAKFGPRIVVNTVTVTDSLDAVANITIPPNAPIGPLNVVVSTVSNGVTYSENLAKAFTVTATDWSLAPASGEQGQTLNVAITGEGFINGATTAKFGPHIVVNTVTVTDSLDAVANITIPPNAPIGAVNVVISTLSSNGVTYSEKLASAFTVTATDWSLAPASGEQGQTLNVAITGEGFIIGATTAKFGPDIVVNTVTVTDSQDAVANITIPLRARIGAVSVVISTVSNGETYSYKIGAGFTITPTIWSVTPATGEQGQTLNVAITGAGFINGVTTAKFGPYIVVNTVTVTDSLDAIANITIPSNAPTGAVQVKISTLISGTNFVYNLKNGFTVTP